MKPLQLVWFCFAISLTGCEYIANINDPGTVDSLQINTEPIGQLTIEVPCKLVLTNQPLDQLTAKGCDYILDGYRFQNEGEKLTISHQNGGLVQREKMAEIYIPCGTELYVTGNAPCVIVTDDTLTIQKMMIVLNGRGTYTETALNIECNDFNLTVYGRSSQTMHQIQGTTTNAHFHMEGCTTVDASLLSAHSVSVTHQSVGQCKVSASETLVANIYSTGNIYYKGSPLVTFLKHPSAYLTASGNIYRLDE